MKDLKNHIDQPITNKDEDLLEHSELAKKIASLFANWQDAKSSLVTALYGEWGSGKTSVKNLMIQALEKNDDSKEEEKVLIVEFNPWEWANQDMIIESFFTTIVEQLDRQGEQAKKIAKAIQQIRKITETSNRFVNWLSTKSGITVSISIFLLGLFGVKITDTTMLSLLSSLVATIGVACLAIDKTLSFISYFYPDIKKNPKELKENLSNLLKKKKAPLIIILDDLDRLSPTQLRTVIQLVKVNMDFPNTVFMLLYQQDIVEKMLTNEQHDGAEYMKKIIQLPLTVPTETTGKIIKLLSDELYPYLGQSTRNVDFLNTISDYIFRNFRNIRDVKRFLISFKFHISILQNTKSELFIDPLDLFILETIRMFDIVFYKIISNNKLVLSREHWDITLSECGRVLDCVENKNKKDEYIEILNFLFTKISDGDETSVTNRVYNVEIFEKYFALISYDQPSLSKKKLLDATNDELNDLYKYWHDSNRDQEFIQHIHAISDDIPLEGIFKYLRFLLIISDQITKTETAFVSSETQIISLFEKLLAKLATDEREYFLLKEIDLTHKQYGFLLISQVFGRQLQTQFFRTEGYKKIKLLYLKKIQQAYSNDLQSFFNNQFIDRILIQWEALFPEKLDEIQNITSKYLELNYKNIFILLKSFVRNYSINYSITKYYIRQELIQRFVSKDIIDDTISKINQELLSENERYLMDLYHENHKEFP